MARWGETLARFEAVDDLCRLRPTKYFRSLAPQRHKIPVVGGIAANFKRATVKK
jgi:hypothetical protein